MLKHFEWIHLIVFELEKMEDEGHDSFLAVGASSASVSNSCRETLKAQGGGLFLPKNTGSPRRGKNSWIWAPSRSARKDE